MLPTDVRGLIEAEVESLVSLRRDLHAHPELSFRERRTSEVVQRELSAAGIGFKAGLGGPERDGSGTGVLGYLPGTGGGDRTGAARPGSQRKTIALRADMDALPILEASGAAHASTVDGVMHACGHDGHTAILIGAARVLSKLEDRPNNVAFVFQPAEEGGGGGEKMCLDGVLAGDDGGGLGEAVDRIFGLHGWPGMRLGTVGTKPGPLLASTDDFVVKVRGKGGHAAMPHLCIDPVLGGAAIVQALQQIASRNVSPLDSVVCTVARFEGGFANNVIPQEVELEGTVRTLRDETRAAARTRFFEVVEWTAKAYGVAVEIDFEEGYPVTRNDAALAAQVAAVHAQVFGPDRVVEVPEPFMGGEDFSYYGQRVPACFFLLGLLPEGRESYPGLHHPTFDFNDDAIAVGVEAMVSLALA